MFYSTNFWDAPEDSEVCVTLMKSDFLQSSKLVFFDVLLSLMLGFPARGLMRGLS